MIDAPRPASTRIAPHGMVASIDHLASSAGLAMLHQGGTAADAAVAANAVLAVTSQHMCGLGGDLFALIHEPGEPVRCLNASGRAGSGADLDRLRAEGHPSMPFRGDIRSVPVPGCVDGWSALHGRFGRLPLHDVLAPAIGLAEDGFPASPLLALSAAGLVGVHGAEELAGIAAGAVVRRPGIARVLRAIADGGRAAFYTGEFGDALMAAGDGEYTPADLERSQADWVDPLTATVWGHAVSTIPPNSQGYLSLAGALIAERLDLPDDVDDPRLAHLLIESARQAAFDRPAVLHEHADGNALIGTDRIEPRAALIDPDRTSVTGDGYRLGGTMYLCVVDGERRGISLIQSNAAGFGSHIVAGDTGIHLHNRGAGFSVDPSHPAAYGPGRRPPHTLSPALVRRGDGELRAVLGTMGGDAQPQIVLQMLVRLLAYDQTPGDIIGAPRWALDSPGGNGFDTWTNPEPPVVVVEPHAPDTWVPELARRGHQVSAGAGGHGHAHLIEVVGEMLYGAADPRAVVSAAVGH